MAGDRDQHSLARRLTPPRSWPLPLAEHRPGTVPMSLGLSTHEQVDVLGKQPRFTPNLRQPALHA